MKKFLLIFVLFLVSCAPKIDYSKDNPDGSRKIGNNIYRETYTTYFGCATTTDVYTVYLTDSLTFRVYVGTVYYTDTQFIGTVQIDDDNILVYKTDKEKIFQKFSNKKDTVEKKIYNIPLLKKEGKFE